MFEFITAMAYGGFIFAGLIIVASVAAAKIVIFILGHAVLHVTNRTKTTLDNAVLGVLRKPVYFGIVLAGVYFALDSLNYFDADLPLIKAGFTVVWVLLGAYTATKIVKVVFQWYGTSKGSKPLDETMTPIIRKIASVFIYTIAGVIILRAFGVEITPLLAGLGVGGLVIALALQDSLSNLFSGTFMVSDRMIKVGDTIQLDNGTSGVVEEIGWRSTKIRTPQNNFVVVANTKLASDTYVTNFSVPTRETSFTVDAFVPNTGDLDKVEEIALDVARGIQKTKGAVAAFEPSVRFNAFTEFSVKFSVTLCVESYDYQVPVRHEFIKALKKRYDAEQIEISFPVMKVADGPRNRN